MLNLNKSEGFIDYFQDGVIEKMMNEVKFKTISRHELKNDDVTFFKRLNLLHMGISFEKYVLHKTKSGINLIDQSFIKETDWLKCYRYAG